jgi:release factor glutamine methyltransferase
VDFIVARLRAAGCVFAEDEAAVLLASASGPAELAAMVEERVAGRPLEHVVGWVEFAGRRILVDPGVFVPRRRTELLVREAAARLGTVVVDLACGCGAVGLAVGLEVGFDAGPTVGTAELHAVDIEPAAVACARRNLEPVGGRVYEGDLFEPLPRDLRGRVDVLVANVPYVPSDAVALMPPEARDHEPRVALDGGADGLDVLRRVAASAAGWLAPGGHVLMETGTGQVPAALDALAAGGLTPSSVHDEELAATVVIGRR